MRRLPRDYSASDRIGPGSDPPLGEVVGAARSPGDGRLFVADGMSNTVVVFGEDGSPLDRIGRQGRGPGEFRELGGAHGSRPVFDQVVRFGDDFLAVNDLAHLNLFRADGGYLDRIETGGATVGPFADRHLAAISPSTILMARSGAGRMSVSERDVRTRIVLREVRVEGDSLVTSPWGRLRNPLVRLPPFEGFPPRTPYLSWFRRTWDAVYSGLLATYSYRRHGVCFFDVRGELVSAARVDAPVVPVDGEERERVLERYREERGPSPPMMGGSWEEYFQVWPDTAPRYVDVSLSPDSVAWLERPTPDGGRRVDLVHTKRGYLGSMSRPGERLPLAFRDGCALVESQEIPERLERAADAFYGLTEWCPGMAGARRPGGPSAVRSPGGHDHETPAGALREVVAAQWRHQQRHGSYAIERSALAVDAPREVTLEIRARPDAFVAIAHSASETCAVRMGDPDAPLRAPAFLTGSGEVVCR